jgi:hypothetical protein
VAEVVLVDLATGASYVVAETRGWDTQLGANAQWGGSDHELFFNDLDIQTWRPFGVLMDPLSGRRRALDGPVYAVSPDGRWAASVDLRRNRVTQEGYGVVVPPGEAPQNRGLPDDDGVYLVDVATGESNLLVSIQEIVETATPPMDLDEYAEGDFHGILVKWSMRHDRIMYVLRWTPRDHHPDRITGRGFTKVNLITMARDGSEIHVAIPNSEWGVKGGHHPNWCPDSEHVLMNLDINGEGLRFVQARYDGTDRRTLTEKVFGSGHPTLHPDGRHMLTDAYPDEPLAAGDGTSPIRWIDLETGEERELVRIEATPRFTGPLNQFRLDLHPAWDPSYRRIAFNGCPDGTRRVYVADLSELVA